MKKLRKVLVLFTLIAALSFALFTSIGRADSIGPNGLRQASLDDIRNAAQTQKIVRDEKGNKVFAYGKLSKPSKRDAELITKDYFEENDDVIKHRTKHGRFDIDYRMRTKHQNVYGKTVLEYHQTFKGIPVYNTTKYVHIDKDGVVDLESGYFKSGLDSAKGLEQAPKLSSGDALNAAAQDLGINLAAVEKKEATLMIYAEGDNVAAVYAYKVDLVYNIPQPGNWTVLVDAVSGVVVKKINHIRNTAVTAYGYGVMGNYWSFTAEKYTLPWPLSGYYTYLYNNNSSGLVGLNYNNGTDPSSATTYMKSNTTTFSTSSTSTEASICDAYRYANWTYDYYKNRFGRNSYNNAGSPIRVGARYSVNHNNAWSIGGGNVVFGDGDGVNYRAFSAATEVVAHEITHEIIGAEIGLDGSPQAAAINESTADVFGAMVEYYVWGNNVNCWIVAEKVTISGTGYRNMSNPPAFGHPDHFSSYSDTTDCHANAGILNKAAYLISEGGTFHDYTVTGIGKDKTAQIYYRAMTNKTIPSNCTFDQFYHCVNYAAAELYGWGSAEQNAVHAAFSAVGIADFWKIISTCSNKVLDVTGVSKSAGTYLQIWDYTGVNDNQLWQLVWVTDSYLFRAKHSGMCMDVPNANTASGVQVWQYYQNYSDAQKWMFYYAPNSGEYFIASKCSGKYLDVQWMGTANGTPVWQYDYTGTAAQIWRVEYID